MRVLSVPAIVAALLACGDGPLGQTPVPSSPLPAVLGNVALMSETASCPAGADACWEVEVSCEALVDSETARLRIGEPLGVARGTVLFMTGGGGSGFWSRFGSGDAERVLGELNAAGFRTVEIAWTRGWLVGSSGDSRAKRLRRASRRLWPNGFTTVFRPTSPIARSVPPGTVGGPRR